MTGGVGWVEESGLSFLKGGKYNTKGSECWGFPRNFGPHKRDLVDMCRGRCGERCVKEEHCAGKWGATQGNLLFQGGLI